MNSFGFNFNKRNQKSVERKRLTSGLPVSRSVRNPYSERGGQTLASFSMQGARNPVISGYFVREKSYKEIIISRINTALCCILGFLVLVCLASYYFVVVNEIQLRQLSKETIQLNYDNADMQNKLDNLQSFSNVDMQVSKLNILQRAKQVIELPAADLPSVNYDKMNSDSPVNRFLGY